MYSPVKSQNSSVDRSVVKEQKRQQLAILLINKFRNKFGVVTTQEHPVDQLIINEIQKLLGDKDQATQTGLKKLDEKLEKEIKKLRDSKS